MRAGDGTARAAAVNPDDVDISALLSPSEHPPSADRGWPWMVSAAVVTAIGVLSATSGARVPFLWLLDFGFHEFGHLIAFWAPWQVTALAGSFVQVAVPLALSAYFAFARREGWAAAPLLAWAGASLRNVAVYIADAPYQRLDLWGGEGTLHDWAQLLQGQPMMHSGAIAWTANTIGWFAVAGALAAALAPAVARYRDRSTRISEEHPEETLPVREPRGPIG